MRAIKLQMIEEKLNTGKGAPCYFSTLGPLPLHRNRKDGGCGLCRKNAPPPQRLSWMAAVWIGTVFRL